MTRYQQALLMIGLCCGALQAQAASFDCQKAKTSTEHAICATRSLNDQDVKMATMYEIVGHTLAMGGRGALYDQQRDWLTLRNQCGAKIQCLTTRYQQRIDQLQASLERVYSHGPF